MTDADFMAAVLSDGKPHTTNEILHASFKERGVGLTVHSRAADLRKRGLQVECRPLGKVDGRNVFEYQVRPSLQELSQSDAFGDEHYGTASGGTALGTKGLPPSSEAVDPPPSPLGTTASEQLFTTSTRPDWA